MAELNTVRFRDGCARSLGLFDFVIVGAIDDGERNPVLIVVMEWIGWVRIGVAIIRFRKAPGLIHRPT